MNKTKYLMVKVEPVTLKGWINSYYGQYNFEKVEQFIYLGPKVTNTYDIDKEI